MDPSGTKAFNAVVDCFANVGGGKFRTVRILCCTGKGKILGAFTVLVYTFFALVVVEKAVANSSEPRPSRPSSRRTRAAHFLWKFVAVMGFPVAVLLRFLRIAGKLIAHEATAHGAAVLVLGMLSLQLVLLAFF